MRLTPLLAVAVSSLLLAGCDTNGTVANAGLESVNQPVVSRADHVFDVPAETLRSGAEAQRLSAWFDAMELRYGDVVTVDDPSPYGLPASRAAVASAVARYGLLVGGGAPITEGAIAPGHVRIVVTRSRADVPNCPNWRRPSQPELEASTMSNYGCAVNSNFAAMVADPQDLVRGRGNGVADPRTVNKAIDSYRTAKPTGSGNTIKAETTGAK